MPEKNKSRDKWNKANGYKDLHVSICAACRHFTLNAHIYTNILYVQGTCNVMDDEGLDDTYVRIHDCCNRFSFSNALKSY